MNRKIEWIINQNRDGQTEPWIKLRYAVGCAEAPANASGRIKRLAKRLINNVK